MTFDLLTRKEWGATAKQGPAMRLPARGVTFHHSVTLADDDHDLLSTDDVAADMREIEAVGVSRFGRFSYCYAIHPSGVVGEGAGLTIGAHTGGHNSTRIGVVFIGDLTKHPLTPEAETAATNLLRWLAATGALHQGYDTDGHRDYKATACPADAVYKRIPAIHAAALAGPTQPQPPKDDDMPTAAEIAEALRPIVKEEVGKAIGWTRAIAEDPELADTDPQSKRLADRAGHLNPYRKK